MYKGRTSSGFEFEVEESAPKSWFFMEAFAKAQNGEPTGVVDMVNILLPGEQKRRLIEHVAKEDPTVPTELISRETGEIMELIGGAAKKLLSSPG